MTLTVRLDATLEAALERHCAATGSTKSLVVQESLATYLTDRAPAASTLRTGASAQPPATVSRTYRALAEAGFIGAGELGGGSADKAAVRARAMQRIRRGSK